MKILRYLLFGLLGLLLLYVIVCFAGSSTMGVKKSVTVNASASSIMEEVSDFSRWNAWSPWHKLDTAIKNTFTGEPGTVGHSNTWTSEKVGNGEQKIVEIRPGEFIRTSLDFRQGDLNYSNWTFAPKGDSTEVTWTMEESEIPFFFRGLMVILGMQEELDKSYADGLNNLKAIAEAKPKEAKMEYEIVELPDMWYLGKRMNVNMKDTDSALFASTYGELIGAIGGPEKMAGMPFAIGHMVNMETGDMDLEIALPIAAEMPAPAGLHCGMIPAGKNIKAVFVGPYEGTGDAWGKLYDAMGDQYTERHAGYEVYANDPATVSGPSEYITWLIVPIE